MTGGLIAVMNLQRIITCILQLPLTLQYFIASFSSLFGCLAQNLTVLVHSHCSHSIISTTAGRYFQRTNSKIYYTLPAQQDKRQTDTISNYLVNIVEHLAAQPDISHRSWQIPKTELKESEYWT